MTFKTLIRKKRFWLSLATVATAAGYLVSGDAKSALQVLGSFAAGQ